MAYKINRSDENVILPDGPATVRDVQRYVIQKGTPEFYELEAAEVIEVYVDEEDLPKIKGKPDCTLVLAWNFFDEIKRNNSDLAQKFISIKNLEI